jgi:hypothetical protein
MDECRYYNDTIRCYRDGRVERFYERNNRTNTGIGWQLCKSKPRGGYHRITIDGVGINVHRIIAYCFMDLKNVMTEGNYDDIIDHINHIRTDNRVENLRIGTQKQNTFNRTAKGYSFNGEKYYACIKVNNKSINLGSYDTEAEARDAYLKGKEKYHVI